MKRLAIVLAAILATACSDSITPPRRDTLLTGDLTFLQFDSTAFASAQKTGSFWAVKGADRKIILRYGDTGDEFLRFDVVANALWAWPDGTPFADGDSVLITVDVDSAGAMSFHFSPSGLQFNPDQPATLKLDYSRSAPDVNRDGVVDTVDALLEAQAGFWKRELPVLPWQALPTKAVANQVAHADVFDFTDFGMAVN